MRTLLSSLLLFLAAIASAQTTANDDSCDIAVTPAATLLLPYFEVDFTAPPERAQTTIFTVVNTSHLPQIARATIWTDWAWPVLSFDLFLTSYDIASVNLYDLLAGGRLPEAISSSHVANPNHLTSMPLDCARRPTRLPELALRDLRSLLTTGRPVAGAIACAHFTRVGTNHGSAAIGSITIDLVSTCSPTLPDKAEYFQKHLLYDNVLIGDWMFVTPRDGERHASAGGLPLVHIRAVPEGGPAGAVVPTNLPFTFHDRLVATLPGVGPRMDRRQPLPAAFAARFVESPTLQTRFAMWRESFTSAMSACITYANNSGQPAVEVIRFDEHENAAVFPQAILTGTTASRILLPSTAMVSSASPAFPPIGGPDAGGWLYMNLSNGGASAYSAAAGRDFRTGAVSASMKRHGQAWVSIFMSSGPFMTAFDAVPLANGCSVVPAPYTQVQPGANVTP